MYVVTTLIDALVGLPPWLVLILVFAIPAAEAGLLIGVFVPGETAVLLGGVVAHGGGLPLWTVIVAAALGAVAGDQVGFLLGTSLRQPARGPPPRPGVPLRRSRTRIGPHPAARGDGSSARAVGGRPARAGPRGSRHQRYDASSVHGRKRSWRHPLGHGHRGSPVTWSARPTAPSHATWASAATSSWPPSSSWPSHGGSVPGATVRRHTQTSRTVSE
jgi:hypothetical protein